MTRTLINSSTPDHRLRASPPLLYSAHSVKLSLGGCTSVEHFTLEKRLITSHKPTNRTVNTSTLYRRRFKCRATTGSMTRDVTFSSRVTQSIKNGIKNLPRLKVPTRRKDFTLDFVWIDQRDNSTTLESLSTWHRYMVSQEGANLSRN